MSPEFDVYDDIIDIVQEIINIRVHQIIIFGPYYFNL